MRVNLNFCWKCKEQVNENPYTQGIIHEDDDAFIWYCQKCSETTPITKDE